MSEKFEAEVLKMFTKIDSRLDNIENTLDEHTEEFKRVNKVLDEHTKILNDHTKKLDEHTKILNDHTKKLDEHTKILDEHSKLIRKNTEEIEGLTEVVQSHTNALTKFEFEFGKKIDTLFDTFQYLDHEYLVNKVETDNYKRKSFQQEVRISALENLLKNDPKITVS